jgi:hypothetical protein
MAADHACMQAHQVDGHSMQEAAGHLRVIEAQLELHLLHLGLDLAQPLGRGGWAAVTLRTAPHARTQSHNGAWGICPAVEGAGKRLKDVSPIHCSHPGCTS